MGDMLNCEALIKPAKRMNFRRFSVSPIRRFTAIGLSLVLFTDAIAAPAPAPAGVPIREPLIEVSVDSLEISENNSNILGILWGQDSNPTGNQLNFVERAIPSLFNIGQLDRSKIAG